LDNIIRGKDLRSWNKERNDKNESILMSTLMFPQLTNQQFINCAYLEILPVHVPGTSMYRAVGTLWAPDKQRPWKSLIFLVAIRKIAAR
jgi:hypothetical protein